MLLLAGVLSLIAAAGCSGSVGASRAWASSAGMQGMIEEEDMLAADPSGTMGKLRMLGIQRIRLSEIWIKFAPNPNGRTAPRGFHPTDPGAYSQVKFQQLDAIIRAAKQYGIAVDLGFQGFAPRWADGPGAPKGNTNLSWEPNPRMYQQFMQAMGTRYGGNWNPQRKKLVAGDPNDLPKVSMWSVWNEPDYGPSLAPQGVPGHLTVENSPRMYRNLVDAAWTALHRTGHGSDTIIWGELAPRGMNYWGVFSGMKPLVFLRAMYCVDSRYRPLTGAAAAFRGCPTNAAGAHRFRALNPALFQASGISDHPYMRWYRPDREASPDPDYSTLGELGSFERGLDRLQRAYGSQRRIPIWNTEFGYLTTPPKHDNQVEPGGQRYPWVTQATAAYYLNWAEYISWRDPRVQSFFQYLLKDPFPSLKSNDWGGYASGQLNYNETRKPGYYAWRVPLYLPVTSTRKGRSLEVWGCARPAAFAARDTGQPQSVQIQFKPSRQRAYTTLETVQLSTARGCYFDVRAAFASSGTVRLAWSFPSADLQLSYFDPVESRTAYSREVAVTVH